MFRISTKQGLGAIKHASSLRHVGKVTKNNVPCLASHFTTTNLTQSEKLELNIDTSAVTRLQKILDTEEFLRVVVEGGGCSGYQYKFEVDNCIEAEEDIIFTKEGVRVICDEVSLKILNGSTVEFHQDMLRAGFRVVDIPLAEKGCSCGVSFSVKL